MAFNESCTFCKIACKQAPASIIYEDNEAIAFLDIRPLSMGHTLVIPSAHYDDIFDTPQEILCHVHSVTKKVALALKKTTNADGVSIIQQNGKAAGQDIFHLHVHVVPRFEKQKWPQFSELKEVERSKLEEMAKKIRQQI